MSGDWEIERWHAIGDRALIEALRAGEAKAIDEFISRFEPLVQRYALQLRIVSAERAHWVGEVLYEVAMTLGRGRTEIPRHIGAYIAGACRRRAKHQRVSEAVYDARLRDAAEQISSAGEAAIEGLCSESSLRSAQGPEWEAPVLSTVLERLVSAFDEGITADERTLLQWLASQVSYTTIADWLGISRPAAVSRIQRLRGRLIEAALRFGAALESSDRAEFVRFLRRTGAIAESRIDRVEHGTTADVRAAPSKRQSPSITARIGSTRGEPDSSEEDRR